MSEDIVDQEASVAAPKPRAPRSRRVEPEMEEPPYIDLTNPKDKEYAIISLHDSEDIPPPGQGFGVNGRFFNLRSNTWYKVPAWLLSTINNAIVERPIQDENKRFVGTRPMKRFPYETFRG